MNVVVLVIAAAISFGAGILSALLGIGGGLILVPLFHYAFKMNMHQAVGTSLAIIVPTAIVGATRHAGGHFVDWKVFIFAGIFTVIGGWIGAGISMGIDAAILRKIFAAFLVLVAIKMFLQ